MRQRRPSEPRSQYTEPLLLPSSALARQLRARQLEQQTTRIRKLAWAALAVTGLLMLVAAIACCPTQHDDEPLYLPAHAEQIEQVAL